MDCFLSAVFMFHFVAPSSEVRDASVYIHMDTYTHCMQHTSS